ncbi:OmpA family protein [Magnetospirillum fulvum]|uniref:Outer membrane protein OmpA n=1 Tax=Magnetospirillum fulvum TaxID=1082 RepID=A0A1H6H3N3_MAGFU|nr:outer membrane beta-barrel protein [Magnetospirillum fulvum]SEH28794.1 Outer membrane protein OmpA [Magnetospirillum fulvum]
MRNLKILLAAAAVATTMPTLAHAQWYVGVDAGASILEENKMKATDGSHKASSDIGWLAQGQIGYAFGPWKVEGELSYRDNGVNKYDGAKAHGSTTALATMANGIYEFLPESKWHPFVGAGIGIANVDAGKVSVGGVDQYKGDDWQFAYQGFAGVGYDVSRNVELKAQYRYFATLDYDTKSVANGSKIDNEYRDHALLVGFTYKFNPPPAPAPVYAAPAPVAAPAPAPVPVKPVAAKRNFIVFFDFDKAVITPEAARIIQQAAGTSKSTAVTRIDLTGHTDLSGSERYNQALSIKRGNAVKAELVKLGIPAAQIDVVGKGKSDPLVATPDGVREPQNRRVEIVLP